MKTYIEGEELLTPEDYEKAGLTIAEPVVEKNPSNAGLIVALVSFNFAFAVVDILSAIVVGTLTRWYYGLATVISGALFMGVHELLFTRAYNNRRQRNLVIGGAIWAVLTILFIALVSVVVNLSGLAIAAYDEYFMMFIVGTIVINVVIHGVLTAIYYYSDDGHAAKTRAARARARARVQNDIDDSAEIILTSALERRIHRRKMLERYRSPKAVRAAIIEAGGDDADQDGIPDWKDAIDNRTGKPFSKPTADSIVSFERKNGNPPSRLPQ